MKHKFEILNERYSNELMGYLFYDDTKDKYSMRMLKSYKGKHPTIFFKILNERGIIDVPEHLVMQWVQGRVITPQRQGIEGILEDIGLKEYDLYKLLIYGNGRCNMDSLCIREVK